MQQRHLRGVSRKVETTRALGGDVSLARSRRRVTGCGGGCCGGVAQWRRRILYPAWHRWLALYQSAMDKEDVAAHRWFRVSATSALHQWRANATDSLRLRSWEAFVVEWRGRRLKSLSMDWWRRVSSTLVAGRKIADDRFARRAAETVDASFRAWVHRAAGGVSSSTSIDGGVPRARRSLEFGHSSSSAGAPAPAAADDDDEDAGKKKRGGAPPMSSPAEAVRDADGGDDAGAASSFADHFSNAEAGAGTASPAAGAAAEDDASCAAAASGSTPPPPPPPPPRDDSQSPELLYTPPRLPGEKKSKPAWSPEKPDISDILDDTVGGMLFGDGPAASPPLMVFPSTAAAVASARAPRPPRPAPGRRSGIGLRPRPRTRCP